MLVRLVAQLHEVAREVLQVQVKSNLVMNPVAVKHGHFLVSFPDLCMIAAHKSFEVVSFTLSLEVRNTLSLVDPVADCSLDFKHDWNQDLLNHL